MIGKHDRHDCEHRTRPGFRLRSGTGRAGAAIANHHRQYALAALYYLWYFLKKSRRFSLALKDALCGTHIAVRVCLPASRPPFSALMCVSTIVLNLILVAYGNAPVAAIGIVFKANMFITFLQMGLQTVYSRFSVTATVRVISSVLPIPRRFTKLCCFVVGLAATALFFCASRSSACSVDDSGVITYGVQMLIAYMLSGPFIGFSVRQYELYAVGQTRSSGYRAVRAAAGSAAHSPAVSAEMRFSV